MGPILACPSPENRYQQDFIARLVRSFQLATGRDLTAEAGLDATALGESAWTGDFALLAHRGDAQASLNYGNLLVQRLWACGWDALTVLPSSATAPAEGREARAAMMAQVTERGFVSGYSGTRISRDGRLFTIRNVTIWRLRDPDDFGVAAFFRELG